MEEYYGWIFVEEKMPPQGEKVLIAYVENGDVEYLLVRYDEERIGGSISLGIKWFLPQYYKQSCVKAWRKVPPFVI